jgi:hypothetical protein
MFEAVTHQEAVSYVKKMFKGQGLQILHSQDCPEAQGAVDVIFILNEQTECMTVWNEAHGIYGEW